MKEQYTRLSSEKDDKEVKIGRFSASCYSEKADLYSRYEPIYFDKFIYKPLFLL